MNTYKATGDTIEATPIVVNDIVLNLRQEELDIIKASVDLWNNIVTNYENKTIAFGKALHTIIGNKPHHYKTEMVWRIKDHPDLCKTVASDRIYQAFRIIDMRPDLSKFADMSKDELKLYEKQVYLKNSGAINWEFYFELYKWTLTEDLRVRLEEEGRKERWPIRKLNQVIRELKGKREESKQKQYVIKMICAMLNTLPVATVDKLREDIYFISQRYKVYGEAGLKK